MGAGIEQVPEWLNLLATFVIVVIVGVAGRLGWVKSKGTQPTEEAEVIGAVVDIKAVKMLAGAIDFALDRVNVLHDERIRSDRQHLDEMRDLRKDIRELISTLRESATKGVQHG